MIFHFFVRLVLTVSAIFAVAHSSALGKTVSGTVERTFKPALTVPYAGWPLSHAVQPDGKIVIAGSIQLPDGRSVSMMRLNVDGTADESFVAQHPAGGVPRSFIIQPDGEILVYGYLGEQQQPIVRLNRDGSIDEGFAGGQVPITHYLFNCMALQPDGKILLGREFRVNGGPSTGLVPMSPEGVVEDTTTFSPPAHVRYVHDLAVQPDGGIIVGGAFFTVDGQTRNGIAHLRADGSLDETSGINHGTGTPPWTGISVDQVIVQPDGKILLRASFLLSMGSPAKVCKIEC